MDNRLSFRRSSHRMLDNFQSCWKPLALTGIAFKLIALVVLTPLLALLFRLSLALSGSRVIADLDIAKAFLSPAGAIIFILGGAVWLAIIALEQASLTGIICARTANRQIGVLGALRFSAANAWPVLRVTARMVVWGLVASVPFLAIAATTYLILLTKHDINYYLNEKLPELFIAGGIGGLLLVGLAATAARIFTGWLFALPVVLFERTDPSGALSRSQQMASGSRLTLLLWIIGWILASLAISTAANGAVIMFGRLVVSSLPNSIHLLAMAAGLILLLWAVVMAGTNLLGTTAFAVMLFSLYRERRGNDSEQALQPGIAMQGSHEGRLGITRSRLALASGVGLVVAVVTGMLTAESIQAEDRIKIIAHRGASKVAPENTMAAIQKAIEDGADWVEIDVQETADGNVVVFHDSDFMRVSGVDLKIWDATIDDLEELDIGSWFDPAFNDQRVVTLAEVLAECKGKIGVNIELKYYGHDERLEERVVNIVETQNMASEIVVMSLKIKGVRKMKSLRPDWQVGLLMSVAAGNFKKTEADFLAVNSSFANRRLIRSAHRAGKEIYVWTVNDADSMSRMISRGVDGLITDRPEVARSVLERRAELNTSQRLLLELAGTLDTSGLIAGKPSASR